MLDTFRTFFRSPPLDFRSTTKRFRKGAGRHKIVAENELGLSRRDSCPLSTPLVDEFSLFDQFLLGSDDSELDSRLLLEELSYAEQVLNVWIPTTAQHSH